MISFKLSDEQTMIRDSLQGFAAEVLAPRARAIDESDDMPAEVMPAYYRAYRTFMAMTRDPAYQLTFKLKAGEMIVFDNRRVLHGREAFDPASGFRHLHGCYVDRGEFNSRLRLAVSNRRKAVDDRSARQGIQLRAFAARYATSGASARCCSSTPGASAI